MMTVALQISILLSYYLLVHISGAMLYLLPILLLLSSPGRSFSANPKSISFIFTLFPYLCWTRIFSSFISLWMIFLSWRYVRDVKI